MTRISRAFLLALAVCLVPCLGAAASSGSPPRLRLAEVQDVAPTAYALRLAVDPSLDHFTGSVTITISVKSAGDTIWLNQRSLKIADASSTQKGVHQKARVDAPIGEFFAMHFPRPLKAGTAQLELNFSGLISERDSAGIFRRQDNGNWYAFTQFESTDARQATPSFDEPSYKTPWKLTLEVPESASAVANSNIASQSVAHGKRTVVFNPTQPLPSYLLAFAVGPFEYVDGGVAGVNHTPVRIITPKGRAAEAAYAASVSATILGLDEAYYGFPYAFGKSDQIAIPNVTGFGAMENPGLVTYQHTLILSNPSSDRIVRQRAYASVAAHELAHQWTGDLVTMTWWDDTWLNEAFATWREQDLLAAWKPEWHSRLEDLQGKFNAENQDSLVSARRIRQPIESSNDIANAFDGITYVKGAAVIRMFQGWIGDSQFQKAMQEYMRRYAFKTASAPEFLATVDDVTGRPIARSFKTFLDQPGVPLLSVDVSCKEDGAKLTVSQERFLPTGSQGKLDQLWEVPVCVRYGGADWSARECHLLTEPTGEFPLAAKSCPSWLQANDNASGYYHVRYPQALEDALTDPRSKVALSESERLDLIGNAQALASGGKGSLGAALHLAETLHDDPNPPIVEALLDVVSYPRTHLINDELRPRYEHFISVNFGPRARALGWTPKPGESEDDQVLRARLVRDVATLGADAELAGQARELTDRWFADPKAIDPNLLGSVLRTAAYYGDAALMQRFLDAYVNTKNAQTKARLMEAMTGFRDRAAIELGMQTVLHDPIPFAESNRLLFAGQADPATRAMALAFTKANYEAIVARMPNSGEFTFGAQLPYVGNSYCDAQSRDELNAFFGPKAAHFNGAPRRLAQILETIDLCIARQDQQVTQLREFLTKY